jgi:hypothetical protein
VKADVVVVVTLVPLAEPMTVAVHVALVVPSRSQCSMAVALTSTPAVVVVAAPLSLYSLAFSVKVWTYDAPPC